MIDTDKYEGVRTPFGTVPMEDILKMLEPIRERDNKIAELDAEVKRLRDELSRQYKWADNAREYFGDEAMFDLYDIYGGEEE